MDKNEFTNEFINELELDSLMFGMPFRLGKLLEKDKEINSTSPSQGDNN